MNFSKDSIKEVVAWSKRFSGETAFANTLVKWIIEYAGCDNEGERFQHILTRMIDTYKNVINTFFGYPNNGTSPMFRIGDVGCHLEVRLPYRYQQAGAPPLPARQMTEKVEVFAKVHGDSYWNNSTVSVFTTTLQDWDETAKKTAFWKALRILWDNHRCVCNDLVTKEYALCNRCVMAIQRTPCVLCGSHVGRMENKKISKKDAKRLHRTFEGKVTYHKKCKKQRIE
jgi:hypothetical protein